MTDMHRGPGLKFPKGASPKAHRKTVLRSRHKIDEIGSDEVRARSGGRCEIVIDHVRCPRKATQVHHMLKGRGQRGRGQSALALYKQHACVFCHSRIELRVVERVSVDRQRYTDTYRTKGRP